MVRVWSLEEQMIPNPVEVASDGDNADPALHRLTAAFLRLLAEHWVQAEKVAHLSRLLARNGAIDLADLEAIGRETEVDPVRDQAAAEFVRQILAPMREPGRKVS
jgi:hypothetical protein